MRLHSRKQKITRWFLNTPRRSSDRAYETSKQLQSLGDDSSFFMQSKSVPSKTKESSRTTGSTTSKASNISRSRYMIYCSLLEYRLSISALGIRKYLRLLFGTKLLWLLSIKRYWTHSRCTNNFLTKICLDMFPPNLSDTLLIREISLRSRHNFYTNGKTGSKRGGIVSLSGDKLEDDSASSKGHTSYKLDKGEEVNRKLVRVEATSDESDTRGTRCSINFFPLETIKKLTEESPNYQSADFCDSPATYESISLVPRSVTRTLSRFEAELTNQSSVLVRNDFDLSKNQALVSLKYVGYFLLPPLAIPIGIRNSLLEPWIRGWWNIPQTQVFINPFQEEKALRQLRKVEALPWLNDATGDFADTQLRNYDANVYDETVGLAIMYNEPNIQLLLQLVTDVIGIAIPVFSFIMGRKGLAVSNSRIQESFHSLNDTMKAFSILSLTDLCVGFHSPHGWEILIGSFFEHFGLIPNKYVISCFVSTFPVILDTISKYWIFRHLNRTSPSIVATYHTMSG
uniref:chloroplast envelope membrane protein n=1 Tax=Microlepia speluncae TaxID=449865 RepID=UPI001FA70E5F|nr:chloroplast envelope membrane protein [Microlepia speluncae]ULU27981.1 chloroplast envelope membrane protein [Microlepia speluncae]